MRGYPTRCDRCGIKGEMFGVPLWGQEVVCRDKDACLERCVSQKDKVIEELKQKLEQANV